MALPASQADAPHAPNSPSRTQRTRWHRRSRQVHGGSIGFPVSMNVTQVSAVPRRDVDFGVCMMDDGWALLVHTKNASVAAESGPHERENVPPHHQPRASLDTITDARQRQLSFNSQALCALEGKADPVPADFHPADAPGHNLHSLHHMDANVDFSIPQRRQSLRGPPPPSAYLRPPPGRPVSVINPPATQAPVSCLRRQSLPPGLDSARTTSIKFADEAPPAQSDLATRVATVASLNETLRLRKSYAALQSRHVHLYDAALDARNELSTLQAKMDHSHKVMEHLIDWGLAMQTENEILREQLPHSSDGGMPPGPINVKTAAELRALFNIHFAAEK